MDPTPGSVSTPWQYREAGGLQGGEAFGFLAERIGGVLAPALAPAATLVRSVAGLDPASVLIVGLLTVGACLVIFYARKLLACRRRKRPVDRQVRVSKARL